MSINNSINKPLNPSTIAAKNSFENGSTSLGGTYAKKGEPMYQKDMDLDEDGEVTFDEFNEYCDANGIDAKQRLMLLEARMKWKMLNETKKSQEKAKEEEKTEITTNEPVKKAIYAKKGDLKYDNAMDYDDDDTVTYDEYIDYCRQHSKNSEKTESDKTENSDKTDKVKEAYTQKEEFEPEITVEQEA